MENSPQKILCIEDEHFISELYKAALEKQGYEVTIVQDGEQGLKEAQSNLYDIILLDLMVPTITGLEILKTLRDPTQTEHLKARIIITTNLEQDDKRRAEIETQADGYVIKAELTPKELATFVGQFKKTV